MMRLPSLIANRTVTRVRAVDGAPDAYGNVTKTWSDSVTIGGCEVQPAAGSEINDGRQTVIIKWQWWGPVDADVEPTDRIIVDGYTFEVEGDVMPWRSVVSYKTALLKRVEE